MREIRDRVHVAGDDACREGDRERAVVHACKRPCHRRAVGYEGTLPRDHPHRHALREDADLYLNLVDRGRPHYDVDLFDAFFDFTAEHWAAGRSLLLHCNAGRSRSPVLALLLLAGITRDLDPETYESAVFDYASLDPDARPGTGLRTFVRSHWDELMTAADRAAGRS